MYYAALLHLRFSQRGLTGPLTLSEGSTDFSKMSHFLAPLTSSKGANKLQQKKCNIVKTVILIGLCFIACWTSAEIRFLLYNLGYSLDFSSNIQFFSKVVLYANCSINPFIYAFKYEEFQIRIKQFFTFNAHAHKSLWKLERT